jgi:hypothetical protein
VCVEDIDERDAFCGCCGSACGEDVLNRWGGDVDGFAGVVCEEVAFVLGDRIQVDLEARGGGIESCADRGGTVG